MSRIDDPALNLLPVFSHGTADRTSIVYVLLSTVHSSLMIKIDISELEPGSAADPIDAYNLPPVCLGNSLGDRRLTSGSAARQDVVSNFDYVKC